MNRVTSRVGNSVSKSNIKTKRLFKLNLQEESFSVKMGEVTHKMRLKVSRKASRTVLKYGGLEGFLSSVKLSKMSPKIRILAKRLRKIKEVSV